jgi:DNA-binding CsgD family transcriptional regulator
MVHHAAVRMYKNLRQVPAVGPLRATAFVFFDKKTGAPCFQVRAALDGSMPMDEAACLLALQCVWRQQKPTDFRMMTTTGDGLVAGLATRAVKLMRTCGPRTPVRRLSRRQEEVLGGVANGFSNKEIASNLNMSVRTVKFHVSALFVKFEVNCRGALIQKVANLVMFRPERPGKNDSRLTAAQEYSASPATFPDKSRPLEYSPRKLAYRRRA